MTLTPRRHRSAAAAGVAALLAVTTLTACAQEEPTNAEVSSSAPAVDDAVTTTADGTDDGVAATSEAPDAGVATSSAPGEDAAATTEAPTTIEAADGSFELEVPGRWEDALDLIEDESILVAAKDTERIDDFFTNVVVTEEEYVRNLTAAVEETAQELAGEDGEYELLEPVEVDGNRAPGYTLVRQLEEPADAAGGEARTVAVHQTQRWISHDQTLYVVTFSAVDSQAEETASILDDILASWTWNE